MARGKNGQPEREKVWDVLRGIGPDLIKALMRYAGTRNQAAFANKTGLSANQVNRYFHGREFPERNLAHLSAALGLSEDSAWWLFGQTLAEKYRYARFEVPSAANEVREPHTPYRLDPEPELPEEIRRIMALDLSRLDPNDRVRFARQRNALRDQAEAHRELVDDLLERYQAALRRPRS